MTKQEKIDQLLAEVKQLRIEEAEEQREKSKSGCLSVPLATKCTGEPFLFTDAGRAWYEGVIDDVQQEPSEYPFQKKDGGYFRYCKPNPDFPWKEIAEFMEKTNGQ